MTSAALWEYTAVDRGGARCRGAARAATEIDAYRQLTASGLTPVRIRAARNRMGRRRGVSHREIAHFTYQLSVLIGARIPISQGIRMIAELEPQGRFRGVVSTIAARIESGSLIADAVAEHSPLFGDVYIQTLRAAEQSGNLVKVLEYLSEMLERGIETRQQTRSALMYPACVLVVLALAVVFMIGVVIPRFAVMYTQRQIELPVLTRVLVGLGQSVQGYWWAYLGLALAAGVAARVSWRSPRVRNAVEVLLHRVPVLSSLLVKAAVSRFCRVLSTCLNSGLPLIESLTMAGRASGRSLLRKDVDRLTEQVRAGGKIGAGIQICQYLPPFARRMLASGEDAGELPRMCAVVARHYERDAAASAKNIATVIEPVLIVLIAGVVLLVALGVFLPMWNMVKLMN